LEGETTGAELVAIMGLYQTPSQGTQKIQQTTLNSMSQEEEATPSSITPSSGRIIVYGDSNCADNSHMQKGSLVIYFCFQTIVLIYLENRLLLDAGCCAGLRSYWW